MSVDETIRSRRTIKLKADPHNPLPDNTQNNFKKELTEIIEIAGRAPFHYVCSEEYRQNSPLKGYEPWRFHVLDLKTCRKLLDSFNAEKPVRASDGIRRMLAAADALILVTWLPEQTPKMKRKYYPNTKNMEHIAATGAAIQNLLLAATARGITNYWSSGGALRKKQVLEFLNIPADEIVLGAVFLFPEPEPEVAEIITGKNRDKRSGSDQWMEWVSLD